MNREQRRRAEKDSDSALKYLKTPCTIAEAAQISRGVAEDVLKDYQNQTSPLQVSLSLQVEMLKSVLVSAGIITEEEMSKLYMQQVEEFNAMQQQMKEEDLNEEEAPAVSSDVKMGQVANDVEVQTVTDEEIIDEA